MGDDTGCCAVEGDGVVVVDNGYWLGREGRFLQNLASARSLEHVPECETL